MTTQPIDFQGALLALDTSTSHMSVALTHHGILQGELNSNTEKNHSIHLIPNIRQVLSSAALQPRDLKAIAVGVGPGSYTGVRIGVTTAKTLAWTNGTALIAVSSLAAMALGGLEAYYLQNNAVKSEGTSSSESDQPMKNQSALAFVENKPGTTWVVPMIEARRGQAFTSLYQVSDHKWSCLVPDAIRLMATWSQELLELSQEDGANARPERIIFVGETKLHEAVLNSFCEQWSGESANVPHNLRAAHIAELGQRLGGAGHVQDPHGLVPNYTQLTEAEVNLIARQATRG